MFASIVILALFLGGSSRALGASPAAAPVFPVKPSANSRYLVDQNGVSFFIQGDSPWDLLVQLTKTDAERYLEDRKQKGFNAIIAELMERKYSDNAPYNKEGNAPFTTPGDFSTPNEAYFAHIDWVLSKAAEKGILVFLFPCFLGYNAGSDGWWAEVNANGATKCRNYGRYLGNRYKNFKNIIWVHGGDYSPPPGSAGESYALEILLGIKDTDATKLHTFHGRRYTTALDQATFSPYMDLDAVYPGDDLLAKAQPGDAYQGSLRAHNRTNFKPHFLFEGRYESVSGTDEGGTYTADRGRLRRQAYWANLSGATGHFFGNHPVWAFRLGWDGPRGIGSPGNQDMERLRPVFASRAWHALVPDQNHTVVTAGYGVFGQSDYVTAGRTGDGSLVMAYVPPTGTEKRTLTVDMTQLSGRVEAKWFNPANGKYQTVAGSPFENSGSRNFTTPGNNGTGTNDWVLVLEAAPASSTPAVAVGETQQVGSLATPWNPDFDVVEEPARKLIHFIGTESRRLRYMKSTDGGLTWSSPEDLGAGWAARMATDSKGDVHLIYGTHSWPDPADPPKAGPQASTGWYRVRSSEGWSAPVALKEPAMDPPAQGAFAHRIAVDGNDNVHVTFYVWPADYKKFPWKDLQRTVYVRKPAGAASFEPPVMLRHGRDATGGGTIADPVVDPNGDVHLIYGSWNGSEWRTTHVVRKKDGSWGDKVHDWIQMTSDYSMKAAIGADGVIHVAGFDDKTLSWIYCNNRVKPDVIRVVHVIEDDWEVDLEILVTPDNDVWMSRDNHYRKDDPNWPPRLGGYRDNAAYYVHFDAATSTWGPRTRLSPPGAENSDATKHLHAPKFIYYDGSVRVFYAERKGKGHFKYYQRTLSGPRPKKTT